jgi:hypothetical protein
MFKDPKAETINHKANLQEETDMARLHNRPLFRHSMKVISNGAVQYQTNSGLNRTQKS